MACFFLCYLEQNRVTCSNVIPIKTAGRNRIFSHRGETRALIGGGGEYSYIRVLPDEFLLKLTLMTVDFKRNSSGRTRRYEYSHSPPPPPINALVSPLFSHLFLSNAVC